MRPYLCVEETKFFYDFQTHEHRGVDRLTTGLVGSFLFFNQKLQALNQSLFFDVVSVTLFVLIRRFVNLIYDTKLFFSSKFRDLRERLDCTWFPIGMQWYNNAVNPIFCFITKTLTKSVEKLIIMFGFFIASLLKIIRSSHPTRSFSIRTFLPPTRTQIFVSFNDWNLSPI